MTAPMLDSLDRDVIESILRMGDGYVLDFSDRTFAEFFADFGVPIDDPSYCVNGGSKARRLRVFLRTAEPTLAGRVLGKLLEHRLLKDPEGLKPAEVERFRAIVARLGGDPHVGGKPTSVNGETELLRRVFKPDLFKRLPFEAAMSEALIARMDEARRCIESEAYLAAVILCGSVLEGMCLGYGSKNAERANRAYAAQYKRDPPRFHEWKLREWVEVLARIGDLSPNVEKFGQALRDFRNYVHPAEQLAHRFTPDQHTARIGFQVAVAAVDDLVEAASRGDAP